MKGILNNVKVLDMSRYISGPYCGMLLGDLGADVIKVEKAGKGDDTRNFAPKVNGESVYTFSINRNKRGIEINFRSDEGKALMTKLIKEADVLIENFRPGTMEKMGFGWEYVHELNPKLIMVSISGFGSTGPYWDKAGFDAATMAMSGLMSATGYEDGAPMLHGTYTVDHMTGTYAALSVLAAYIAREQTGQGQLVEISLLESAATMLLTAIPEQYKLGRTLNRQGNKDRYSAPGNVYKTKDGEYILMIAGAQKMFSNLCAAMNKEELLEDPRFSEQDVRFQHHDEIDAVVAGWMLENNADDIEKVLNEHGLVSSRVQTVKDLVENPQLKYRKKLIQMQHPVMGDMMMMGAPYTFSDIDLDLTRPAPTLGQHTEEVLTEWLGIDHGECARLAEAHATTL